MDFEELNDMAIVASRKLKWQRVNKKNITDSMITLMALADKKKINLEDALLNRIEELHKK